MKEFETEESESMQSTEFKIGKKVIELVDAAFRLSSDNSYDITDYIHDNSEMTETELICDLIREAAKHL